MKNPVRVLSGILFLLVFTLSANLAMKAEAGMTLGPQADISVGPNDQRGPSCAYDSLNKRFLVVWDENTEDSNNIFGQLLNQDGSPYGGRISIYLDTTNNSAGGAKAAFDPVNQRFLVTWSQLFDEGFGPWGEGYEVAGQFINTDGSLNGNDFTISPLAPDEYVYEINVGVIFDSALNRFAVLISSWNGNPNNLYIRFVDGESAYFPKITNFSSGYGVLNSAIGYDSNNGRFLVAYTDGDDSNIYARLLNADATFYGPEFAITSDGRAGGVSFASICFDPFTNRFLVIFFRGSGFASSINGQLINADGSMYGDAFIFSSYYAGSASVVFDMVNKKFLVAYNYYDGAFAQLVNPDGSVSGPAFFITGREWPIHSLLVTGGPANFLAVWEIDSQGSGTGRDIYGRAIRVLDDYILYLPEMRWDAVESPYNSTGAASLQMILNYIREEGVLAPWLAEGAIYTYAKSPGPLTGELTPDEMAKVLGHFDPYDSLVSNWSNSYDSLPGGNPYKGYNFSVDTYDPALDPDALNNYMRDICHWMAYTVTKEDWWLDGELVARPNTPAAIPIFGTYNHWVAVNGFSASANPAPQPHTNPWILPDFTVNAFWMKDPLVSGIGQNAYKTAAECALSYFLPLSTTDSYNGKFMQIAEPPPKISYAKAKIPAPKEDQGNLEFAGVKIMPNGRSALAERSKDPTILINANPFIKKRDWFDILPAQLLADSECYAAFNGTKKGKPVLVKRADLENSAYLLLPFNKRDKKGRLLTQGVIILDANAGYFKEASWSEEPDKFLKVNEKDARTLIMVSFLRNLSKKINKLPKVPLKEFIKQRNMLYKEQANLIAYAREGKAELYWKPDTRYSLSPYHPYWKIEAGGYIWYVTQERRVISVNQ